MFQQKIKSIILKLLNLRKVREKNYLFPTLTESLDRLRFQTKCLK